MFPSKKFPPLTTREDEEKLVNNFICEKYCMDMAVPNGTSGEPNIWHFLTYGPRTDDPQLLNNFIILCYQRNLTSEL